VNQRLAAAGGSLDDLLIALQMILQLEHVEYRAADRGELSRRNSL
jgi:hypothetical protein